MDQLLMVVEHASAFLISDYSDTATFQQELQWATTWEPWASICLLVA